VVTNADEAAGRRHQPAFLFLPARDMKEGGGSRWRFVPSVAEEVWKMGKLPYRLAENRSEGSSVIAATVLYSYEQGRTENWVPGLCCTIQTYL